jgi:hypothetical protein
MSNFQPHFEPNSRNALEARSDPADLDRCLDRVWIVHSIAFDSSEPEKSPVGLENCKLITTTRQVDRIGQTRMYR